MRDATAVPGRKARIISLALAGAAVSWTALLTYFLVVVPRWPDLRDSGRPSVALAAAGAALGAFALVRSFRLRRRRGGASALFALAVLPAVFLALYVESWSWHLPGPEGAARVGEKAPALRLADADGRERALEEFRGRTVLLVFFRGPW